MTDPTDGPSADDLTDALNNLSKLNPQERAEEIIGALRDSVHGIGAYLADTSLGSILSCGQTKPGKSGNRWFCVMAVNDAAAHLQEWALEQVRGRAEAGLARDDISMAGYVDGKRLDRKAPNAQKKPNPGR